MDINDKYMSIALDLAAQGFGNVEPNPMVGSVIVADGKVIGKGCHENFGGPHAEINAIEDCKKQGNNPAGAAMYVTLEPCCHHGKTPPCTDAIIAVGITAIIIATLDPSKHADGRGAEQLKQAGIAVEVGLCQTEAKLLNAPFIKSAKTAKPWVTLKWAQSKDGWLAHANQTTENRWISCEQSRQDAHNLRRRADAILVGINTVLADDPILTARPPARRPITRIVMDNRLRIPPNCKLLNTTAQAPVLIFTLADTIKKNPDTTESIKSKGAELIALKQADGENLNSVIDELSRRSMQHLLVEGGAKIIQSFLRQNVADEVVIYVGPVEMKQNGDVPVSAEMAALATGADLHFMCKISYGVDTRISGLTKEGLEQIS